MLSLSSGFLTKEENTGICGVAVLNRAVCGVSRFKPTVKRNNLITLCGVVVYHLAVVTQQGTRQNEPNDLNDPQRPKIINNDQN